MRLNNIFSNKKIVFLLFLVIVLVLAILYINSFYTMQTSSTENAPALTTSPKPSPALTQNHPENFYLIEHPNADNISAFVWFGSDLLIITRNQLLNFFNKERIHEFPRDSLLFSYTNYPFIVFRSNGRINTYNYSTKESRDEIINSKLTYSPSLKKSASFDDGINIFSETTLIFKNQKTFDQPKVVWSSTESIVVIYDKNILVLIDLIKKDLKQINLSNSIQTIISPDESTMAVLFNDRLSFYPLSDLTKPINISLGQDTVQSFVVWNKNNSAFLIEKKAKPREVDFIYIVFSNNPIKYYINDSFSTGSPINFDVYPNVSNNFELVFLTKNKTVWTLTKTPPDKTMNFLDDLSKQAE